MPPHRHPSRARAGGARHPIADRNSLAFRFTNLAGKPESERDLDAGAVHLGARDLQDEGLRRRLSLLPCRNLDRRCHPERKVLPGGHGKRRGGGRLFTVVPHPAPGSFSWGFLPPCRFRNPRFVVFVLLRRGWGCTLTTSAPTPS